MIGAIIGDIVGSPYEFDRGEENSIDMLNAALASMPLSHIDIADFNGVRTTTRYYIPKKTTFEYSFFFDKIVLGLQNVFYQIYVILERSIIPKYP